MLKAELEKEYNSTQKELKELRKRNEYLEGLTNQLKKENSEVSRLKEKEDLFKATQEENKKLKASTNTTENIQKIKLENEELKKHVVNLENYLKENQRKVQHYVYVVRGMIKGFQGQLEVGVEAESVFGNDILPKKEE